MEFPKTFLLLQQEAYLIQSSLLSGLDHLRHARLGAEGRFYTAFFQLSVGLERMMKATFIINVMREHGMAVPTDRQLRDFGHNLVSLFDHLAGLTVPGRTNPLQAIRTDSIERAILEFLGDFANGARYHNLDSLVKRQRFVDPLEKWSSIIERVLKEDVRESDRRRIARQSALLASASERMSFVIGTDLEQKPLDHFAIFSQPRYHDIAAGHLVNYTMTLIRALAQQMDDISHVVLIDPTNDRSKMPPIPYMHEFFDFIHYEKSQILRKRRWP